MSIFIFLCGLLLLNIAIYRVYGDHPESIRGCGALLIFIGTPIVYGLTLVIAGAQTGDGFSAGFAGLTFGFITFFNGIVLLIIGFSKKRNV